MNEVAVLELASGALAMTLALAGPLLGVALLVGLTVSVFQAATQINEMTLTFVPKMLALAGVLAVLGPWMLQTLVDYTAGLLIHLADIPR